MRPLKNIAHFLPFEHDSEGNPKARQRVVTPPLIAHDPEAARALAEAIVNGEEPELHVKRLLILNSIAADENCGAARTHLEKDREKRNVTYKQEVKILKSELKPLKDRSSKLIAEASALAAILGIAIKEDWELTPFEESEPTSMESLAGQRNIPYAEPPQPDRDRKESLAVAIGGGSLLGILLGFLTDFIDTQSVTSEPLKTIGFAIAGSLLVYAAGCMLKAFASLVGTFLYHASAARRTLRIVVAGTFAALLAVGCVAVMIIESNVDRQGLSKAIGETATFKAQGGKPEGLLWISLLVVVPIVGYYLSRYLTNGFHRAARARLVGLQDEAKSKLREDPRFSALAKLCGDIRPLEKDIIPLEKKLEIYEQGISHEFTERDLLQLEAIDNDAIEYSEKAWKRVEPEQMEKTATPQQGDRGSTWNRLRQALGFG